MSMTTMGTGNLQPVSTLFVPLPDSDFADFMLEADEFVNKHSEILDAIADDLELHAKKKKKLRMEDKRWEEAQKSEGLPGVEQEWEEIDLEDIELAQGRPRVMDAYMTFMFMVARGYQGGPKERSFGDLINESQTMYVMLKNKSIQMPGRSTISENVNAVSNQTRRLIHTRHIEEVKAEGLDDFKEMILDSTAMKANSAWPTESVIITRLLERVWRMGNKLEQFGTENFQKWWTECWLEKMWERNYSIILSDTARERRKHYRKLYHFAENALEHLRAENEALEKRVDPQSIKPSLRRRLEDIQKQLRRDLDNTAKVISYSKKRVFEGQQTPSSQKVLSLADITAAFIEKGDREPTIGYRGQAGRSNHGFIGYVMIPEGNANDAPEFAPAVKGWITNTDVVPYIASVDDGYASADGLKQVKELGVEKVSISGSKGKCLLTEEEWNNPEIAQARRDRSKVESSIFTIKYGFDFGRSSRTGLKAVRAEALEKIIAHNFFRAVQMKRQQGSEERKPAA